MFNQIQQTISYILISLIAVTILGCGGSGGGSAPAPAPTPVPEPTPDPAPAPDMPIQSGSLETLLKAIDYGSSSDNQWQRPDSQTRTTLDTVIEHIIAQRYEQAHSDALAISYEVVEFTDTDVIPNQIHYLLREQAQVPDSTSTGGGTYVFYPAGKNLVIEAPHPLSDINTELQAVETYLATNAKALLLAGTRRDSSATASDCQSDFNESDAAHNVEHLFQVAHQAVDNGDTIFLQLHGFGTSSLERFGTQCDASTNARLINLSESVNALSDASSNSFIHQLDTEINSTGSIAVCLYSPDQNSGNGDRFSASLGGTLNTQGRFTNGSSEPCNQAADANSNRFIHVEQSFTIRSEEVEREIITGEIQDAVEGFFQ